MSLRHRSLMELLEDRRLFSGGLIADSSRLIFSDVSGGAASDAQVVTLTNPGDSPITIAADGLSVTGDDAAMFQIAPGVALPVTLQPGDSATVSVVFSASRIGPAGAMLHVVDDDVDVPATDVVLRGLGTKGKFDTLEPSLQWILDTYQIPVNVGTSNPSSNAIDIVPLKPNDEVSMNLLEKAGDGPVTIEPIAAYTSAASPAFGLGYYAFDTGAMAQQPVYTVPAADIQTLSPHVIGSDQFDPGSSIFGIYTNWPGQKNRMVYSEDFRNTWQTDARQKHATRFYPLKNADGTVVPNAYVVAIEEATNHDYQDAVLLVRNVRAAAPSQSPSGLAASPTTARQVYLTWKDNAMGESGYTIDRSVNGGPFLPLVTLAANAVKYTDNNLTAGARYAYRVQAFGDDGVTDFAMVAPVLIPVTYQAEAAQLSGPLAQKVYAGYTGTGYAAFQNATGDVIRWSPAVSQNGSAILTFRYANGSTSARVLKLTVNGVVVRSSLSFARTSSWKTWTTVSVTVSLAAGVNDIVLTSIGASGPLLDSLTVR